MTEEKDIDRNYDNFTNELIPFGSSDIRTMIEWSLDAGKDGIWCAEQIRQFIEDTDIKLEDVDCCYVVLDAILQEARNEVLEKIGKDFINDLEQSVDTYGNYMCSSYDGTDIAIKETLNLIEKVKEKSQILIWFEQQLKEMI